MPHGNSVSGVKSKLRSFISHALHTLLGLIACFFVLWCLGALYFDAPWPGLAEPILFAMAAAVVVLIPGWSGWRLTGLYVLCAVVLAWWLTLAPSNDRAWQPDVARTARAEVHGDRIVLHNVRDFSYGAGPEGQVVERWIRREINLSSLTGMDIFINFWGSPWVAHPIISFQFADAEPIAFSIEIRREVGEEFSLLGGFFRRFELYFVVASERDVVGVRACHRKGEDVYLYRLRLPVEQARARFKDYLVSINSLHETPRWYNAILANCTTAIRAQHSREKRLPWDWRMLVNGLMDRMLYDLGALETGGLGFEELKVQALVNESACKAMADANFAALIRTGRTGFAGQPEN